MAASRFVQVSRPGFAPDRWLSMLVNKKQAGPIIDHPAVKGHPPFPEYEQMLDAVIVILPEVEPVQDTGSVNG